MFRPVKFDLVEELRLRRWARMHYVPKAERDSTWHPVILEEMQIRDAEAASSIPCPSWLSHIPVSVRKQPAAAMGSEGLYYN
jgi:hypothetical protein